MDDPQVVGAGGVSRMKSIDGVGVALGEIDVMADAVFTVRGVSGKQEPMAHWLYPLWRLVLLQ